MIERSPYSLSPQNLSPSYTSSHPSLVAIFCDIIQRIRECIEAIFAAIGHFLCCSFFQEREVIDLTPIYVKTQGWEQGLKAPHIEGALQEQEVNLRDPGPVSGLCRELYFPLVPYLGHYGDGYPMAKRLLTVRLTPEHLISFPEEMRRELEYALHMKMKEDALKDVNAYLDLFFMIYDDSRIAEKTRSFSRNLVFHHMAYPNIGHGQTQRSSARLGVFEAEGITPNASRSVSFDQFRDETIHLHPAGPHQAMHISPNNARVSVSQGSPFSTFFSGAILPDAAGEAGKCVGMFALILHDPHHVESQKILEALQQSNLFAMVQKLENKEFHQGTLEKVKKTLLIEAPLAAPVEQHESKGHLEEGE